ncbi:MAG TPA: efflux RND transporter permease subunit [Victivallales bacterium]|nr:efflux RND transporter permease subunit [Victivallales bacterium]
MIKHILSSFVKNPILSNLIVIFILVGGVIAMNTMYREIQPEIKDRYVNVEVTYTGVDPQEIEESICLKMENALIGLQGVKRIRTNAYEGSARARIYPLEGYNINELKDEVQTKIDSISSFPDGAERPIVSKQRWSSEVCGIVLSGDIPEMQLIATAVKIKDKLLKQPHISDISLEGAKDLEISIEISERKLREYGLTFDEVKNIIEKNGINISAGTISTKVEDFRIKAIGRRYQAKEYKNIPVISKKDGTTVKLGQIATISDSFDKNQNYFIMSDDGKPALFIIVDRGENDDSMDTIAEVNKFIKLEQKKLPEGVTISKFFDTTKYIDKTLSNFAWNGLAGLLLVIAVLWLFLDFKLSLWVALGIPVSLAGAFIVMAITGLTINFFSLFGLIMVVGIIVDDGIVAGESIFERQSRGETPIQAAINGTAHIAWPVTAAVLTTIISFIPLLFLIGGMKDLVLGIPIVVISALSVSLIEALIVLPVHLRKLRFITVIPKNRVLRFFSTLRLSVNKGLDYFIQNIYGKFLKSILLWRYATVSVGVLVMLVVLGAIAGGGIKFKFWPATESDILKLEVKLPEGTPVAKTKRLLNKYYEAWKSVEPDFKTPDGRNPSEGFYAWGGGNSIHFMLPLVPSEEREIPYMELANAWEKEVGEIPEVTKSSFRGMSWDYPVNVNLYGDNQNVLLEASNKLISKIRSYKGTFDIQSSYEYGKRMFTMKLKPAAYYFGLSLSDIANQVHAGFYGSEAMKIQRGKDEIPVKISFISGHGQNSVKYFQNMRIKTKDGEEIPLYDLVKLNLEAAPSSISREDGQSYVNVYARVNEKIANSKEIMENLDENFLPKLAGIYDISYGTSGQSRQTNELFSRLMVTVPLALLAIYFILVLIFKSYFQPVVIMFTIPFGVIGAIIGLTIFNLPISLIGIFGIVALSGVVVNDAIVLIDEINQRLAAGKNLSDAVVLGGKRRFRAIMLTTLTTFFGLMPLVFQKSFTGQLIVPMAVTIAFGILFTTIVTLILVPCFFVILNDLRRGFHYVWFLNLPEPEEVEPRNKEN